MEIIVFYILVLSKCWSKCWFDEVVTSPTGNKENVNNDENELNIIKDCLVFWVILITFGELMHCFLYEMLVKLWCIVIGDDGDVVTLPNTTTK